ncbi:MAG: hypothetical protein HYV40_00175 [Candidatus Levybacteria bacterium]|nr:hypothetical protein [Candidatus Levybacteria bacterium]
MPKKTHFPLVVPYGILAHHLKSPLASVQSLLFILERQLKKEKHKSYLPQIESLQKKVNLLTERTTQVVEYIRLHEDNPAFVYSFFSVQDILNDAVSSLHADEQRQIRFEKTATKEMMGDKALLTLAMKGVILFVLQAREMLSIDISVEKRRAIFLFLTDHKSFGKHDQSESSVERALLFAIASLAVSKHSGKLEDRTVKKARVIRVILPLRQKKN